MACGRDVPDLGGHHYSGTPDRLRSCLGFLVSSKEGLSQEEPMDISGLLASLESSGIATKIRESLYIFPLLESIHVFGLALVFGTIAVIDLRLLGLASTHRPFHRMASDTLKWTWVAFTITFVTGVLMFTTNATVYFHNPVFQAKMALLLVA